MFLIFVLSSKVTSDKLWTINKKMVESHNKKAARKEKASLFFLHTTPQWITNF